MHIVLQLCRRRYGCRASVQPWTHCETIILLSASNHHLVHPPEHKVSLPYLLTTPGSLLLLAARWPWEVEVEVLCCYSNIISFYRTYHILLLHLDMMLGSWWRTSFITFSLFSKELIIMHNHAYFLPMGCQIPNYECDYPKSMNFITHLSFVWSFLVNEYPYTPVSLCLSEWKHTCTAYRQAVNTPKEHTSSDGALENNMSQWYVWVEKWDNFTWKIICLCILYSNM